MISFTLPFHDTTNRHRTPLPLPVSTPPISPTTTSFSSSASQSQSPNIKRQHKSAKVKARRGTELPPLLVKPSPTTMGQVPPPPPPPSKSPPTCTISFENVTVSSAGAQARGRCEEEGCDGYHGHAHGYGHGGSDAARSSGVPAAAAARRETQSACTSTPPTVPASSVPFPRQREATEALHHPVPIHVPVPSTIPTPTRPARPKRRSSGESTLTLGQQKHGYGHGHGHTGTATGAIRRRRVSGNLAAAAAPRHGHGHGHGNGVQRGIPHHSLLSPSARLAPQSQPRRRVPADVRFVALVRTAVLHGVGVPEGARAVDGYRERERERLRRRAGEHLVDGTDTDSEWEDVSDAGPEHSFDREEGEEDEMLLQDMALVDRLGRYLSERGYAPPPTGTSASTIPRVSCAAKAGKVLASPTPAAGAPGDALPSTSQLVAMLIMRNRDRAAVRPRVVVDAPVLDAAGPVGALGMSPRRRSPLAVASME